MTGTITASDFDASDVRLYCDDDQSGNLGRWRLMPDYPKDKTPNSQLPVDQQQWWDIENYVTRPRGDYGCKDPGTLAEVYKHKVLLPFLSNLSFIWISLCRGGVLLTPRKQSMALQASNTVTDKI